MRQGLLLLGWMLSSFPCWAWNDGASTDRGRPLIHALHELGRLRLQRPGDACVRARAWGMLLPPGTEALSKVGMPIKLKELEPGDLVFYNTCNKCESPG